MTKIQKAVVIGGSGFIGSHVADRLSLEGFQVTIYDCKKSSWLRTNQKMVVGDINDISSLNQTIAGSDVVYNFAALSDLNQALVQPLQTVNINILGNINVLEACRVNQVKRFIYASSIYVHSKDGGFYRCSKQACESYIEEYQRVFDLDYTILRFGSLYGTRSDETNGIYRIVKSALEEGTVKYEGHPDSVREYIYAEDASRASVNILDEKFKNQSIVLTGHEPMRVLDLLKMLAEILNLSDNAVEFINNEYPGHYIRTPYSYQPQVGRKYIPLMHVDLGQGLLEVIEELRQAHKEEHV